MNYLTSLRGIAAFCVLLYHLKIYLHQHEITNSFGFLYNKGYLAVDFFFLLSGFIIAFTYHKKFAGNFKFDEIWIFIRKRFARIWPLHAFILFCFIAIPLAHHLTGREIPADNYEFSQFIVKFVLADLWVIGSSFWNSWNTPSWTISGEFFAYLLFPFIATIFTKKKRYIALIYVILLCIIALSYFSLSYRSLGDGIETLGLLRCVTGFYIGYCVYHFYTFSQNKLPNSYAIFMTLLATSLCIYLGFMFQANHFYVPFLFSVILFGLLNSKTFVHSILSRPGFVYFGDISYSLYLNHMLVIKLYIMLVLTDSGYASLTDIALMILLSVISAHFTYQWVERPMGTLLTKGIGASKSGSTI